MKNAMRVLVLSIIALTLTASVSEAAGRRKKKGHCTSSCAPVPTCSTGCH